MRTIYKFIPFEKLTWDSTLSEQKILGRLEANVEEKEFDAFSMLQSSTKKGFKEFQGEIGPHGFQIMGFTTGIDESTPMVYGKIEKNTFGHRIHLTIRFGTVTNSVVGLVFGISLIFALVNLSTLFTPNPAYSALIPPVAIYGIFLYAFKRVSTSHRTFLKDMFEGQDVTEYN